MYCKDFKGNKINFKGDLTIVPSHLFFEFWKVGSSNQGDYDLLAKFLHKFLHFWGDYLNKIWNRERCWDRAFCQTLCTSTGSRLKYNVTIYTLFKSNNERSLKRTNLAGVTVPSTSNKHRISLEDFTAAILSINVRRPENFDRRRSRHVTSHTSKINQSPRSIPPRGLKFYHGDIGYIYRILVLGHSL